MDGARGAREKNLTFPRIVRVHSRSLPQCGNFQFRRSVDQLVGEREQGGQAEHFSGLEIDH
jgi:hypothetical protein